MPTVDPVTNWTALGLLAILVLGASKYGVKFLNDTYSRFTISIDKLDASVEKLTDVIKSQDLYAERRHGDLRIWLEDRFKESRQDTRNAVQEIAEKMAADRVARMKSNEQKT